MIESRAIMPGATLGLFGGGQLGRMFAMAAKRLGYRVHLYAPEADGPAVGVVDEHTVADYLDIDRVAAFACSVDVITYEFENVPTEAVAAAERFGPVRPGPGVLATTQHRIREKAALAGGGFPMAACRAVRTREELRVAIAALGLPAVLKTATAGYDGKGQFRIDHETQVDKAWAALGKRECICESWIEFEHELSVVVARGIGGSSAMYGPMENSHWRHILDVSAFPAGVDVQVQEEAREIARGVAELLDSVGVVCVEFFQRADGSLLVNEIAPRPHNSGHLTLEAHVTSQFEQQVRAICGLPLGSVAMRSPAAMANLLGDLWENGEPRWEWALAQADVFLHLYQKAARAGRKMGHLTALGATAAEARFRAVAARNALTMEPNRANQASVAG